MPERTAEQISAEIAAERLRLADDLAALRAGARSLVPLALGGLVAVGLLSRGKGVKTGLKLLWKLR
jgi:hypothetical protein